MAPVIPCCIGGNIALFPSTSFILRKPNHLTKCNFSTSPTGPTCCSQRFLLAYRISVQLFPKHRSGVLMQHGPKIQNLAAVGADLAVEEPNVVGDGEDKPIESSGAPTSGDASITPTEQSKRPRAVRKSEMPPIKTEELVPGATFTGKVRSIQPFGAFVDFGAFTDGLVHVSRMSDSFVKDVGSIVSVGQEVKVRILDANTETGRISLTMRDSDDISKLQQRKDASTGSNTDKPRPARRSTPKSNQRREDTQKSSKFYKGQVLDGTVKNLTRAGAFISLPEGEEGFLPTSEESEAFGSILGSSGLQVGQEVNVRVLRVSRGQVTLTMKKEEDVKELNMKLNQGVVHAATNPFELAFRRNKVIAAFLEERETAQKLIEAKQIQTKAKEIVTRSEIPEPRAETITQEQLVDTSTKLEIPQNEAENGKTTKSEIEGMLDSTSEEVKVDEKDLDSAFSKTESTEVVSEISSLEQVFSTEIAEEPMIANEKSEKETSVEITQEEEVSSTSLVSEENISCVSLVINKSLVTEELGGDSNETQLIEDTPNQILSSQEVVHAGTAEGAREVDTKLVNDKVVTELSVAAENEMATTTLKEDIKAIPIPEKNVSISSSGLEQTEILSPPESTIKATISPALVKQLREETGAGMMDCKKALAETGGDIVRAQEFLRKKGLASAEKKASRATAEGRVGSYVHDNRIGVLIEINCETDFVSRGDIFKQLVEDLAMQVAACPQVRYLVTEDVPEEIVNKEKEIEMQKEDLLNKPEQIRSKIVEGRISKRLSELALLEQPYIKNDKVVVKDWVKQTVATVGENIKVRRFVRYNLGEGLEKKSQDFATEVAAQTVAKPSTAVATDQSTTENKEAIEKPAAVAVAVSAALVKQLREETGAGMMDCKKALMETGGDLEKAQEYLRKKGLSSADKKSSRLAAEGRISSYVHDSRIGVLIEVNCETDFVGRSEKFKQLVDDLAMQVVACPRVEYVSVEEIPKGIKNKEKELEMQREDLSSKPENIREKIVDGRVAKRLGELALLEQPFIRDDSVLVKDLVKQTVAALGENIKVRRFVRFTLGEGMESTKIEG